MGDRRKINTDWRFHLGDLEDAGMMTFDDRGWRTVTLPHDWAVEHPFSREWSSGTGYLPGGIGWYRKTLFFEEDISEKRVRITFQGIYQHARVWINSNYLGEHAYGYTSFTLDVTPYVRPGENLIAVRVEHTHTADSRWYTGSGIDRHVLLEITDLVCFSPDGVFVTTMDADAEEARLRVRYETLGAEWARFTLRNLTGEEMAFVEAEGEAGETELRVKRPRLWSPEDPFLYQLECAAMSGGLIRDTRMIPCGIRVFRFDPAGGFFLNGINRKLKGVCVHHDAGCLGAAVPKTVWARRLRKLKEMGCNALRTAHNPPDPDLLDLCDEMGFLVMDEAFDEWEGIKNKWWQGHNVYPPKHHGYAEDFPQWHEQDLNSMIRRDRNHPSIVLWSIGNEIDYPNDPYVTPLFWEAMGNNDANKPAAERLYDVRKPDAGRLAVVARKLVDIVHRLDDSRPVTSALSFPELSNETGFADALDLSGYNYREHFYEQDHRRFPDRVILGSENGHDPAAWHAVTEHPYIAGQFLWTGIDFLGECPGWPRRISQAGALDLGGFEKPRYARRRALWTEEPFARIAVGGPEDHGPEGESFRWKGVEGETCVVSCYTNQPRAELWLNGVSLGTREIGQEDGDRACWRVAYAPGTLEVRAGEAMDRLTTPGAAAAIRMIPDTTVLTPDGQDVAQVEIQLVDREGNLAEDERIHCQCVGDLTLMGIENGRPDDLTPYGENARETLNGRAMVYVRAGKCGKEAQLYVWTESGLREPMTFCFDDRE